MSSGAKMAELNPYREINQEKWLLSPDSTDEAISTDQEYRRQWLISEMVESYRYPRDWLETRICLREFSSETSGKPFLGIALLTPLKNDFLLGITAPEGSTQYAEEALRVSLLQSKTAGQGVATDGTLDGTVFLRRRFDSQRCEYINDIDAYSQKSGTLNLLNYNSNKKDPLSQFTPLTDRIENLFFELHSHIRDIDGVHPDEALDELCKLLYVKLFDEEQANAGKPLFLSRKRYGATEEFAATVRTLYQDAAEYDQRVFRLKIPQYNRSRGVFEIPLRLSSPAIAAVLNDLDGYSLLLSDADVKGRAFQRVLTPATRSGMGQYFTPEPIVRLVVETVKPKASDLILDPFCGSAHFLSSSLNFVRNNSQDIESNLIHEFAFGKLHGIEKSDRMVRIGMTDMRLHGDGHSNIRNTDALLDFANYPDLDSESFDIVLTNPPFGSLLGTDTISHLGEFQLADGRKRVPLEILGLERCLQFLRQGGHMVIVIPDSVLCNRGTQYVRDWLQQVAKIRAIVSLPIETFAPFGANIKTSLLYLRKWERGELKSTSYPLCLLRVDKIGYDASGRQTANSECEEARDTINDFFDREGW